MQDRRTFLGIAAASLLPASLSIGVDAQTAAPRPPTELARHALTGPFEGFEVVLVQLNIAPGQGGSGPGHRHPGPVLGYIVEGQMRFAINHEKEQVLPVGATFFEPSGAVHTTTGSARTDGPTRAVVFMIVPKGSPLSAPA
jgi:quercetin dioxygenase-like cupin family protein